MKHLFFLVLLATLSVPGYAQKGYEVGALVGVSNYIGEINPDFSLKTPGLSMCAIGRYNFNTRTSFRIDIGAGRLIGKDNLSENNYQQARNLSFRTDFVDAAVNFEFNFLSLVHGSRDKFFTPYVFGGLAFMYYNPKSELDGTWYALRQLGTEGQIKGDEYSQITAGMTYGMGIKVDLSYEWSLNVELSVRQMGSDYIDDVSTVYPDMFELEARRGDIAVQLSDRSGELGIEPIGQPGRLRGVTGNNDAYYSLRVGVVYYIGLLQCPAISKPRP
jgi:opacity protein-like surface antigen